MSKKIIFIISIANIGPSSGRRKSQSYGSGKETLRLRSIGSATIEIVSALISCTLFLALRAKFVAIE